MKNNHSLKSGNCPVCGSNEVYTDKDITRKGESRQIPISSFNSLYLFSYVCLECGFIENYVSEDQLKNEKFLNKIKDAWNKIK